MTERKVHKQSVETENSQHSPKATSRKQQRKTNNLLMLALFLVTSAVIVAMLVNMVNVLRAGSFDEPPATVETDTQKTMKNDLYEIGNNPTEIQKQYFQELTDAITAQDKELMAEKVVESFAADYFSWRNKDGNYETGGLQYIYGQKYLGFDDYNRWNYQNDYDLFLTQYGKENLPLVKEIRLVEPVKKVKDFTVTLVTPQETWPCYNVKVNIFYEDSKIPLKDNFCDYMNAYVIDNNGRMEIVEIYAYYTEAQE